MDVFSFLENWKMPFQSEKTELYIYIYLFVNIFGVKQGTLKFLPLTIKISFLWNRCQ